MKRSRHQEQQQHRCTGGAAGTATGGATTGGAATGGAAGTATAQVDGIVRKLKDHAGLDQLPLEFAAIDSCPTNTGICHSQQL